MILVASVVVWFLSYYPRTDAPPKYAANITKTPTSDVSARTCEPVFSPLGLNWKAGVALLSGVPAKEIVVSVRSACSTPKGLRRRIRRRVSGTSEVVAVIGRDDRHCEAVDQRFAKRQGCRDRRRGRSDGHLCSGTRPEPKSGNRRRRCRGGPSEETANLAQRLLGERRLHRRPRRWRSSSSSCSTSPASPRWRPSAPKPGWRWAVGSRWRTTRLLAWLAAWAVYRIRSLMALNDGTGRITSVRGDRSWRSRPLLATAAAVLRARTAAGRMRVVRQSAHCPLKAMRHNGKRQYAIVPRRSREAAPGRFAVRQLQINVRLTIPACTIFVARQTAAGFRDRACSQSPVPNV